jgi:hypothetical protein
VADTVADWLFYISAALSLAALWSILQIGLVSDSRLAWSISGCDCRLSHHSGARANFNLVKGFFGTTIAIAASISTVGTFSPHVRPQRHGSNAAACHERRRELLDSGR